jgi:hypothetical protein
VTSRVAIVVSAEPPRFGLTRLVCRLPDGSERDAIAYSGLCPVCSPGDRVLLNTTAVDLGLGSGGQDFVVANLSSPETGPDAAGHVLKLRYTPCQTPVLACEAPESPFHQTLAGADSLQAVPVICCELLSQVPAVLAGLRQSGNGPRTVVVMTDEAALHAAYSNSLASLRRDGFVEAVVTAGQALGGDLEAVNVYSALLAARHVAGAEAVIVTPGPGVVGTGTPWGCSAVGQGQALNAAHALGGAPVAALRASLADPRERHRGISHHTFTALARVAMCPVTTGYPAEAPPEFARAYRSLHMACGGRLAAIPVAGGREALSSFQAEWRPWRTMGRGLEEDPLFFEAAAAAGLAARRIREWQDDDGTGLDGKDA